MDTSHTSKTVDLVSSDKWLHEHQWDTPHELEVSSAGAAGQQNVGSPVPAGRKRRIREITATHEGTNNTVIRVLVGTTVKIRFDVLAQSTRVWSSQDGRKFTAGQQPLVRSSDVTGGNTYISAAGIEA